MAEKKDKAGEVLQSRKNELTVVAQDRNWRSYVNNELRCADQWHADWGFLGANSDAQERTAITKEEKISALQAEMASLNAKTMTTSNQSYGLQRPAQLEVFTNDTYNIRKNPDLMPCPRRPKK